MTKKAVESTLTTIAAQIQKDTGANIPDATDRFDDIVSVALMVPMSESLHPSDPNCVMGLPILFWGKSGIGKSARIRQGANRVDLPVRIIYPSTKQPEDFSDIPVVLNGVLCTACILGQVNELNSKVDAEGKPRDPKGVLFVDEVSCAVPSVQGAMLSMVLERIVGATPIAPKIRILLAANPARYAAGGWSLEAPFANRMAHVYIRRPSVKDFTNYLVTKNIDKTTSLLNAQELLNKNWNDCWAQAVSTSAFFEGRDDSVAYCGQPEPDAPQSGYCWPSPRSWEMAMRSMATVKALGLDQELETILVEACVGEGAAAEWLEWRINADLPNPRDVIMKGWKIDTSRLDRTCAVFSGVTSLVTSLQKPEQYQLAVPAWGRLHELIKAGLTDIALQHAQLMVTAGLGATKQNIPADVQKAAEPVIFEMAKSGLTKYL